MASVWYRGAPRMFLIEHTSARTGKLPLWWLVTIAWKCSQLGTQHIEGFCHTVLELASKNSLRPESDLVYTGTGFSSVLMQQIRIIAVTLKWLLLSHLCFCPRVAFWRLFVLPMLKQIVEPVKLKKNTGKKESFFNCICTGVWLAIQLCQRDTQAQQMRDEWKWAGRILLLKEDQCNNSQRLFPVWSLLFVSKYSMLQINKPSKKYLTFMVLSPDADTMYLSSKSTTLTAARCPTSTLLRVMSVGEAMSHTAMERSLEHVTIMPLLKRRCSTASQWWISVFSISPAFTSHTLQFQISNQRGES